MKITPFINVIEDLNRDLPPQERYYRLVAAIQQAIPCDAIALLKLDGEHLTPVAVIGLADEAMARRFIINHHPRLQQILQSPQLVRFDSNSTLADPYDGLLGSNSSQLLVHDCMGSSIYIDNKLWGVLTLDALTAGSFDAYNPIEIRAYIAAIAAAIKTSQHIQQLEARAKHSQQVAQHLMETDTASEIIGDSRAIHSLLAEIEMVANSQLSVLITGETGVGKELVAKRIHEQSSRATSPMVQINCAALPESIVESELFGHVKGAFSGAVSERSGRFELANQGTLFLDEVGELPLAVQAKLLRALQSGEIQRVGSDQTITVDTRIIAASNRDLQSEVREGRFRADLYHRLSVYPLPVPPLRDRENDVLLLAGYFLEKNQHQLGVAKLRLSQDAIQHLSDYQWPGNVRELEHLLSRASLKAVAEQGKQQQIISIHSSNLNLQTANSASPTKDLAHTLANPTQNTLGLREQMDNIQLEIIQTSLLTQQGNITATAKALKLDRSNLLRAMRRLGIE